MTLVYLVRHAKALSRSTWDEPDALRPLSGAGHAQAAALPGHFGGLAFVHLVSSPSVRCVQTLEPLAQSVGVTIERADELLEGASGPEALALVLDLARDGPVAACTHGDVLLDALAELRQRPVPLLDPIQCKKGSSWMLEVEAGEIRRASYLRPPTRDGKGA